MEREMRNSRDHPPSPPLPEHTPGVRARREAAFAVLGLPGIHISPPSWTSLPPLYVITEHRAELPVLCRSFPLASILHMVACICQSQSPTSSHPLHSLHVQKSILYICVSILTLQIGSSVLFSWFYIHVLIYNVFLFWLTSLCMTDSSFIHITENDPISFLLMAIQKQFRKDWGCL